MNLSLLLLDNQMNDEFDKYLKEIDFLRQVILSLKWMKFLAMIIIIY